MNLETRARLAVDETLQAPVDVEHGLVSLRRTRRQRTATRVGAGVVVAALVLAGVLLRHQDRRPEPVAPVRNGIVLSMSLGGVVEQVGGQRLPTLPLRADVLGPFTFTSDGHRLIYSWQHQVRALDLATGDEQVLTDCPKRDCPVAVDPTGTAIAITGRHRLTVRDLASGHETHYPIAHTGFATWSPDGRALALVELRGRHSWLIHLDLGSGAVTRLAPLKGFVYPAPAWSPDGTQLAYLESVGRGAHRMPALQLRVVGADGGDSRVLHPTGRCYCIRYFPAVTWSPDASRIAVTLAGTPRPSQVGGAVYTITPDGSDWRRLAGGNYQDRLAWQPLVTPDG